MTGRKKSVKVSIMVFLATTLVCWLLVVMEFNSLSVILNYLESLPTVLQRSVACLQSLIFFFLQASQ